MCVQPQISVIYHKLKKKTHIAGSQSVTWEMKDAQAESGCVNAVLLSYFTQLYTVQLHIKANNIPYLVASLQRR